MYLTLYSVGASYLRVTVTARHRRRVVLKRTLVPCHTYTLTLPKGTHRRVSVSASIGAQGTESHSLRY